MGSFQNLTELPYSFVVKALLLALGQDRLLSAQCFNAVRSQVLGDDNFVTTVRWTGSFEVAELYYLAAIETEGTSRNGNLGSTLSACKWWQ